MEDCAPTGNTTAPPSNAEHDSICIEDAAPTGITIPPTDGERVNGNIITRGSDHTHRRTSIRPSIWIDDVDQASGTERGPPGIPKVPDAMRRRENLTKAVPQWIEPTRISIGPYHFPELNRWDEAIWERELSNRAYPGRVLLDRDFLYNVFGDRQILNRILRDQKLKTKHAEKFIKESEQQRDELYSKIERRIMERKRMELRIMQGRTMELRKWYVDYTDIACDTPTLAAIFLVDGCFLLNFINYSNEENGLTELGLTNSEMVNIKRDLFLLENQLPYYVLSLLLEEAKIKETMEEKIRDFVVSHSPVPRVIWRKDVKNPAPLHLLHYMHSILTGQPNNSSQQQQRDKADPVRWRARANWRSCRTVQELVDVGIYFKPSATSCLTDISFKPDNFGTTGCLWLPTISLNTSTIIIFLNLMAFESSDPTSKLEVISYLCFMDSLIDSWDDVKELQAAGVLRNFVGEPKEVAQFFNSVCSELHPNPCAYKDVKEQIEVHVHRYCNSKWRTWYVELKQKYFRSPWSFIALTAAIIALSLTAIQTFATLFPR